MAGCPALSQVVFMFQGEAQQRVAALQAQFLADMSAMVVHRAVVDVHCLGNFLARFAVGDQFQNLSFGGRQGVQGRAASDRSR
jgi:hypothetical protein